VKNIGSQGHVPGSAVGYNGDGQLFRKGVLKKRRG